VSDDVEDGGAGVEAAEELLEAEDAGVDGELAAVAGLDALTAEVGGVGELGGLGEEAAGEQEGESQGQELHVSSFA
jgi:hypothetical protein